MMSEPTPDAANATQSNDRQVASSSAPSSSPSPSPIVAGWSSDRVLSSFQSDSSTVAASLAALASSGELRDFDSLFDSPTFYQACVRWMKAAWMAHDRAHLGAAQNGMGGGMGMGMGMGMGSGSDTQQPQQHKREEWGVDDEEDDIDELVARRMESEDREGEKAESWSRVESGYTFLTRLLMMPEFKTSIAKTRAAFDATFAAQLIARFEPKFKRKQQQQQIESKLGQGGLQAVTGAGGVAMGSKVSAQLSHVPQAVLSLVGIGVTYAPPDSPSPRELAQLRGLLHTVYSKLFYLRAPLRALMGGFMQRFLRNPTYPQGMNEILAVYGAIMKGARTPLHSQHRDFLFKHLMPLHTPNQMLNELTPVLGQYHEALVYVLTQILEKDVASIHAQSAADSGAAANHGYGYGAGGGGRSLCEQIIARLFACWPGPQAANSLKEVLLLHECEKIFEYCPSNTITTPPASSPNATQPASSPDSASPSLPSTTPSSPSSASSHVFRRLITAFLPYLIRSITSYNHRVSQRALQMWQNDKFVSLCRGERSTVIPMILPCLLNEEKHWNQSVNKMRGIVLTLFRDMDVVLFTTVAHQFYLTHSAKPTTIAASASSSTSTSTSKTQPLPPPPATPADSLARADDLIERLKPPPDPPKSAEQKLLETQVTIAQALPTKVQYSDFVFGHVLGEGSFAQVRYAKWIQRGVMPSQWPEYAVKVVSKELVKQQHYEENIEREIRIMNRLAHPHINRLVALCTNQTNMYLVLEYASKGDLHNHISKLGSLDVSSARFLAAEIIRGLEEIHRNQIVYVDLKPENVLVHQSGHIKLSDFGSSRFFEELGAGASGTTDRLEGTADYLGPELLRGSHSISPASDLWAFACVLYQMLAGRTPIWTGMDEVVEAEKKAEKAAAHAILAEAHMTPAEQAAHRAQAMKDHEAQQKSAMLSKMVQFESGATEEKYPENFDPVAKQLIEEIMKPDPAKRIGVRRRRDVEGKEIHNGVEWEVDYSIIRAHPFFEGIAWDTLHTLPAPSLAGGQVAPAPDAQWARRKNSLMFAPMPKSYTFNEGNVVMDAIMEDLNKEREATMDSAGGGGGGLGKMSNSLRAQLFAGNTQSLMASSLKDEDMKLTEEDEEGEDEDEEDEMEDTDESMGVDLQSRMMSAPMPRIGGAPLPPRPPAHPSSRAAGPMAVVERMDRGDGEGENGTSPTSGGGSTVPSGPHVPPVASARPPRSAMRSSLGLRGHRPGIGVGIGLPPAGPNNVNGSGIGGSTSSGWSMGSVPRADATAGPTSLGMGLRKMGGNSTASALLARVLNKSSSTPPNAALPSSAHQQQR